MHGGPTLSLYAAGSLRTALTEIARRFAEKEGVEVATLFGASGTLRERIEQDGEADLFASADLAHPERLAAAGRAAAPALFARNPLCALVAPGLEIAPDELLEALLSPELHLGTSTPGADPSGDYAIRLFAKAEALSPGAEAALTAKAAALTGAPDSPRAPAGRNLYAWVIDSGQADLFLTYRTNGLQAQAELPGLQLLEIPAALAVEAEYGLTVLEGAPVPAWRLAFHILSTAGQAALARHGFTPVTLPKGT